MLLTAKDDGFVVKGPIKEDSLFRKISKFRVSIAPLRYGAVSTTKFGILIYSRVLKER